MKPALHVVIVLIACSALAMPEGESLGVPQLLRAWHIAFVRDGSIWVCNGDGSGQKLLVRNGYSPAWSPDKSHIAFARDGDIWVAAAHGSREQTITSQWAREALEVDASADVSISWHPRNRSLTFSHRETFHVERANGMAGIGSIVGRSIFDVPVSGAQPGKPTVRYDLFDDGTSFVFGDHAHPAWSPSATKLAFTRNGDIWIAEAKGGLQGEPPSDWKARRVAAVAEFDEPVRRGSRDNRGATRLSWLPDGRRLVYGYDRLQGSGFNEIHLLDTVSGKDSVVVGDALEPYVSPDGRFVLYRAYGDPCGPDGSCICAGSLDGRNRVKLLRGGSQPVW